MLRKLKNYFHLLQAVYWNVRCGFPGKGLYVIGVTGTDGKTTTTTLIYEILKAAGIKAGIMTTVSAKLGEEEIDTGLHTTNPGPELLQPLLKKAIEQGITHMVLEVTSHGLDQNRMWGVDFKVGVLTNITHEHLDYHKTMERYVEAKAKLFKYVRYAILPNFQFEILNLKSNSNVEIIKYSKTKIKDINESLVGDYNKYNIAAAEAVAKILDVRSQIVEKVIKDFSGVAGRREEVKAGQNFRVFVDFAHTPNALEQVLTQLKKETKGELIVVFGCTGERDKSKRPMMGEIAARLADVVIITSDDTRSESQDEIADQIMSGIHKSQMTNHKIFKENDRKEAIIKAVKMAKKGDVVLLAGKGHEKSILIGNKEQSWSDAEEAKKIILAI
jgi:UDP-N-acetylmuramoyl-L-alanyl-D-glutamate--2,6-diaminopimelate ligase